MNRIAIIESVFISLLFVLIVCSKSPTKSDGNNNSNNNQNVIELIYVAYNGNRNDGILIIDTENYAIVDSIIFDEGLIPMWMKLSADSSHLYVLVNDHNIQSGHQRRIALIDLNERQIIQIWNNPRPSQFFDISSDERYCFSSFRDTVIAYDHISQDIVYILDNDSLKIISLVSDPIKPGFYASYGFKDSTLWGYDWIFHYNVETNKIDHHYVLDNTPYLLGMAAPFRLTVTTDGHFLFAANNMGYGIWNETYLHVIDIQSSNQIFRGRIGGFAHFAITRDNRYLYATDPGRPLNETVVPTGVLFQYDILANSLEPYLDFTHFDLDPYFDPWPAVNHFALLNNNTVGVFDLWATGGKMAVLDLMEKELVTIVNLGDYPYNKSITGIVVGK